MSLLHAGVDSTVSALKLGHARTLDPTLHPRRHDDQERGLVRVTPSSVKPGRQIPGDQLLA